MRNTIRSLQLTKAAGPDQINNRLLKKLPRKAIVYLTHIMNACFKYSYFPTAWKQANVIPILKPGKDPSDLKNYRPISLLNPLSKILERLLLHRLKSQEAENRRYINEQFGFREKYSTSHQLLRVTKFITSPASPAAARWLFRGQLRGGPEIFVPLSSLICCVLLLVSIGCQFSIFLRWT
jgi:hypothetical protein